MKKIVIGILIACLYSFPFVYFSMYQDFKYRSMRGYLLMIVATFLLALLGKFSSNFTPLILGNIVSGIVSFYFNSKMMGIDRWNFYFKPFSPSTLLVIVIVLNLIPQLLGVMLANKIKNKVKDKIY